MIKAGYFLKTARRRYLTIGISVYVLELLVIFIAQMLGAGNLLAVSLAFWIGLLASFGLQKVITFGDKRRHRRLMAIQIAAFSLLVFWNYCFTLLVTHLLTGLVPPMISRSLALGITVIWNFYIYKTYLFVPKKKQTRRQSSWQKFVLSPVFGGYYLVASMAALVVTVIIWSVLGAQIHQTNSDQLVNSFLFETANTWQNAILPEQHSFLIKWPLFYIVKLFGFSTFSLAAVTVAVSVATVAALAYLLYRIERRPLMIGTVYLALASILIMVPSQPHLGALLPVNMAMLATRNLEYILYAVSLICLVKATSWRTKWFAAAIALQIVLIASDKLFLPVSIAGAILAWLFYGLFRRQVWWRLARRWFVASLIAGTLAALVLILLNRFDIVQIAGKADAGPYGIVTGMHDILLGLLYAMLGILTNFGANPAFDSLTVASIPEHTVHRILSTGGFATIINLIILSAMIVAGYLVIRRTVTTSSNKPGAQPSSAEKLSIMLLSSAIAVLGLVVITKHYYAVDARYLTLWLFALFICGVTYLSHIKHQIHIAVLIAPVLVLSLISGSVSSFHLYDQQQQALNAVNQRNKAIARALAYHPVDTLVGDYWRVLPIKDQSEARKQAVLPLANCTQPRDVLTSSVWQSDLSRRSFAYLLTLEKGLTDYPACNLSEVVNVYGLPDSSVAIGGSINHPRELLLFYDRGKHSPPVELDASTSLPSILPVALTDIPNGDCLQSTIVNVVAHQDDDLLFLSPDLQHDIRAGRCVRSIYLTAGDAGANKPYWLAREHGSEAAYASMAGIQNVWTRRNVQLPGGQFISLVRPNFNDKISLIFVHLPDGNLTGEGFASSKNRSLQALQDNKVSKLKTVDNQSSYTASQLSDAIAILLNKFDPAEIRTHSTYVSEHNPDHSDHMAVARIVSKAYEHYRTGKSGTAVTISFYLGYPVQDFEPNIDQSDLSAKEAAFRAYALFDPGVCGRDAICAPGSTYKAYLARQYKSSN